MPVEVDFEAAAEAAINEENFLQELIKEAESIGMTEKEWVPPSANIHPDAGAASSAAPSSAAPSADPLHL